MIRLDHLRLRNFRCFEDCEITFRPDLTVLVARNGQGKTAILDGIALALELYVDTVAGTSRWRGFDRRDFRQSPDTVDLPPTTGHVEFEASGVINGQAMSWRRRMRGEVARSRTSTKEASVLAGAALQLRKQLDSTIAEVLSPVNLPLIAYYGTGRRWGRSAKAPLRSRIPDNERCMGYDDCLDSAAGYGLFVDWYESTFRAISEAPITGVQKSNRGESLLAAVNQAVDHVLAGNGDHLARTGWHGLHWDRDEHCLMLSHHAHGRLPLDYLSDGVRTTVALVADAAHRCARLNPHFGENAAAETPGILLIDEIDLHLHPEWQQTILGMIRQAFPNVQMIVTTHSPQVLSAVNVESIRTLQSVGGTPTVVEPRFQTRGVESADAMREIMHVESVAEVPEANWLRRYRAAIEEGREETDEGLDMRRQLIDHFGVKHPVMIECDRLIRFSRFKRKMKRTEGSDAQD